jgi:hypothetical protein
MSQDPPLNTAAFEPCFQHMKCETHLNQNAQQTLVVKIIVLIVIINYYLLPFAIKTIYIYNMFFPVNLLYLFSLNFPFIYRTQIQYICDLFRSTLQFESQM